MCVCVHVRSPASILLWTGGDSAGNVCGRGGEGGGMLAFEQHDVVSVCAVQLSEICHIALL